ncbi:hypothetical protein M569_02109 [Genlisea aurea]|uniref:Protein transport protein sec16 n=1 Tax=Genlisea aurea TaxID=192259 RepID=S8D007_9LAMI|nr:hypothetical protein M569_02109 [Genlisea aurea]
MASSPPPFQVEDNTDEDFFDKLVSDDDNVFVTTSGASHTVILNDGNESDEAKAFANLSLGELGNSGDDNFANDVSGDHYGADDLSGRVEAAAEPGDEVTNLESEHAFLYSKSLSFEDFIPDRFDENKGAEVLPDLAWDNSVQIASGDKSIAPLDPSNVSVPHDSTGVNESSGVKEVDWSAFQANSAQISSNSYSDFFSEFGVGNADDEFDKIVDDRTKVGHNAAVDNADESSHADNFNSSYQYNEGHHNGAVSDQSSYMGDLNSSQYWDEQYPGWKYDPNSGQWYQVDSYYAGSNVVENTNTNSSEWGVADGHAEVSYIQQNPLSISGTVGEAAISGNIISWNQTSYVSDDTKTSADQNQVSQVSVDSNGVLENWNQDSHAGNGYPPHMVFDPQYPGWYYDTILQQWLTLDSYTASTQNTASSENHVGQDSYSSANSVYQNDNAKVYSSFGEVATNGAGGYNAQVAERNETGSFSGYNQPNGVMWVPETAGIIEAASPNIRDKPTENPSGQNFSKDMHGNYHNNFAHGIHNTFTESHTQSFSAPSHDHQMFQDSANFSQPSFQSVQTPYVPASGRSNAGRPAHALGVFGFGGKLIVLKPTNSSENLPFGNQNFGGQLSIMNLAEVVTDTSGTIHGRSADNYFQALCQQPIPGPLTGGSGGMKELNKWIDESLKNLESSNVDYRKTEVLTLLLSLLKVACQHYGKLRSPYGTDVVLKESDGPDSEVARLFVCAKNNGSQFRQYGATSHCLQYVPSEGQMQSTAAEVQNLLVSGRKIEALQCAQEGQLWGPAIVLAAQLGDQFYVETIKQMALRLLVAGSPLRTLCLLISGRPADIFSADGGNVGYANMPQQSKQYGAAGMLDDWQANLAMITANRTKDDELVLVHLGDCLWKERSDAIAAHICYLVAEASFEAYSDSARLCLVGADHWKSPRTYASPEAIQRTEIYEYSKTLGNSQFVLHPFQPYKFIYALMLAEVGKMSEALKYCQAILKSLKMGRTPEVENLRHLVSSLEERINHQQGGFSTNLAPKVIGKLLNLFDSTAQRVVGGLPPSVPSAVGSTHGNDSNYQAVAPRVSASQSTMVMSSLVPSMSMEPISEWAGDGSRKTKHTRSVSEPDFGRNQMKGPSESLNETNSSGSADKASAPGGTSRFARFNFGSQLLQKTVDLLKPKGRQAKLGETNKFYYDEKLKRWVEEGAEPPAEESAPPPPPTTSASAFQNVSQSDYNAAQNVWAGDASHSHMNGGSPELKTPPGGILDSGMPPLPPTTNQYSSRGRVGVRSRYVDTFNRGVASTPSPLRSPPPVKPAAVASATSFFVPAAASVSPGEEATHDAENSTVAENASTTPPSPSSAPPMQRIGSMSSIPNRRLSSGDGSRRTASWSGSFNTPPPRVPDNNNVVRPLGEVLGFHNSSSSLMSSDGGSSSVNGDDLHEVEL